MSIILIIVIVAADIFITAAVLAVILLSRKRSATPRVSGRDYEERSAYATPCNAVVMDAKGDIPGGEARRARMELTLGVAPPEGKPYRARAAWLVDLAALGRLRRGSEIHVKVDKEDRRIVYPGGDWAKFIAS